MGLYVFQEAEGFSNSPTFRRCILHITSVKFSLKATVQHNLGHNETRCVDHLLRISKFITCSFLVLCSLFVSLTWMKLVSTKGILAKNVEFESNLHNGRRRLLQNNPHHLGENCWDPCGQKPGVCSWCGPTGYYCCRCANTFL